ncbi:hypothetical protein ABTK09_19715, partial [Acinetobacter baumannii]
MTNAQKMFDVYGILGFIRFVSGYYMLLITGITIVGEIGKHQIFQITETQMVYLTHPSIDLSAAASQLGGMHSSAKDSADAAANA